MSRLLAGLAGVALVAGLACADAAPAAVDDSLALTAAEVPGFRAAGGGARVARRALGRRPPRSLARAPARGAAFARGARRLRVGVFLLRSRAGAARALRQAGGGFARLPRVGDAARRRTRATRRTTEAVVLLRSGRALGAVRLTLPGRASAAAAAGARAYAQALAARLGRVLALTAWQRTLDGIGPRGSITAALARRAFAIAYGPLPGARRPRGRLGVPVSATLAMQLAARAWPGLTPAQRSAVERALGAPHGPGAQPAARASEQTLTPDPGYQAIADKFAAYYGARLATSGPVVIKVFKASEDITTGSGGKAWADALPLNAQGEWGVGAPAYCRVRVPPAGQAEAGKPFFQLVMAHEVFHCFQFHLMDAWRQRSAWIIEGTADWAAVTAYPAPVSVGGGPYKLYLQTAGAPLFGRAYDATGFWGRADETGGVGSLWSRLPAVLDAPDDPASFALAGATLPAFVDTWASASFRYPGAGSPWNQLSPFAIPHTQVPPPASPVTAGATLGSNPYALRQYQVVKDVTRPLVNVTRLKGALRAGTTDEDFGPVDSDWFCFGKCECPGGSSSQVPQHRNLPGFLLALGLTGGAEAGGGRVTFHALDEFCKQASTDLTVSGAFNARFTRPGGCQVFVGLGDPNTLSALFFLPGVGSVTLEVRRYTGKGTYQSGPSRAVAVKFGEPGGGEWSVPPTARGEPAGTITVSSPGDAQGAGATGTVKTVSSAPNDPASRVTVTGRWTCGPRFQPPS